MPLTTHHLTFTQAVVEKDSLGIVLVVSVVEESAPPLASSVCTALTELLASIELICGDVLSAVADTATLDSIIRSVVVLTPRPSRNPFLATHVLVSSSMCMYVCVRAYV